MVSFVKFIPVMVIALTLVMTLGVITRIKMAGTSFNTAMIFYKQLIQVFKLPFSLEKYRKPLMKQLQKKRHLSRITGVNRIFAELKVEDVYILFK